MQIVHRLKNTWIEQKIIYKRKLSDGKEYEVTYTKGEDGNY